MKHIFVSLLALVMIPAFAGDVPKYQSKPVAKPKTVTTASGLKYTITAKGNGPLPKNGDKVFVHYTGTLTDGTVFDSSTGKAPYGFKLGQGAVIKGWDEAILLLHGGDKAKLEIPAALAYGNRPNGKIPANSILNFEVELMDIIPAPVAWVPAKGMDTITTQSGLKYIIFKENKENPMATKTDVVHMHYTGFLTDGKIFDSSVEKGKPLPFPIGRKAVIPGWEEIALLMHKGDKFKVIVPPALGYGDNASRLIPAKSTLIFDMELIDLISMAPYVIADSTNKVVTPGGTTVYKIKSGEGPKCEPGKRANVKYTGYLLDGTIFDSSYFRDQAYGVTIGKGGVISGWQEALQTARQGDKIRIVVPYQQAYGEGGRPPQIPAKSTLVFDMEIESVQ